MATPSTVRELVHEGWRHLQLQKPLAAWSSWNLALRIDEGDPAAREALDHLAASPELPAVARTPHRLRPPYDEDARQRWDVRFRERALDDLEHAANAFRALTEEQPDDTAARYNLGLCFAWQGFNVEAIGALAEVVSRDATEPARRDAAVSAWMLAEILRQGAGAEALADAVSCTLVMARHNEGLEFGEWLGSRVPLLTLGQVARPSTTPTGGKVFEWLDRPMPDPTDGSDALVAPRVRCTLHCGDVVRLVSSSAADTRAIESNLHEWLGDEFAPVDRSSTPLPIAFMDLPALQYRLPQGLGAPARDALARDAIARYHEDVWARQPRMGLADDRASTPITPREAARGSAAARVRLEAVILVCEQMANRPNARALYGGYRFDTLRTHLGLEPLDTDGRD